MDILLKIFAFPGVKWVLWLIVIDYVLGFIGAIVKKEFRLGKVAKVMEGPVLKYVFGLTILNLVSHAVPPFSWLIKVGVIIVSFALLGSIFENLGKLGISVPEWLKKE